MNHSYLIRVGLILFAYLLGGVPFGWILSKRFFGTDVRDKGSGNIGATNVARVAGKGAGLLTLVLDVAKGVLSVLVARAVLPSSQWGAWAGLAAIVGHIFPVYLKFRGGKGVSTALGVFSILVPKAVLVAAGVFLILVLLTRIVSVGSMISPVSLPLCTSFLYRDPTLILVVSIAAVLIFVRHAGNLSRLLQGKEPKLWGNK